jgi:hypothetical protein
VHIEGGGQIWSQALNLEAWKAKIVMAGVEEVASGGDGLTR